MKRLKAVVSSNEREEISAMKTVSGLLHSFIQWLRRPERFIQKLKAIYPHCHTLLSTIKEDACGPTGRRVA